MRAVAHYCFITGFLRSGTTLVEKLVHALPGACIGPQPFPFLYYDTKHAFLRARGAGEERYPLGHLFGEQRYRPEDFRRFLDSYQLSREAIAASFAAMNGYRGWKLPAIAACAGRVAGGSFAEVYRSLCDCLPSVLGAEGARLRGAKEVFCEEYMPYFLAEGVSVLLVVRDIRDVFSSLKHGEGASYADRRMPMLHIARQWRKSVAFALQLAGASGFEAVRYEELVERPRAWLDRLATRLGCPPAGPGAVEDLRDQEGGAWQGNSSFAPVRGVSRASVGRFAEVLPASCVEALEALCAPEMKALGLERSARQVELGEALERAARETELAAPDQSLAAEIEAERRRARLLAEGRDSDAEQRRWALFPRAYQRLSG
jgi:hypothetical protein